MAFVSVVIIAALVGSAVAYLTDRVRAEMRRFDAGADRVAAQIDREQAHLAGRHARPGGQGPCLVCGLHDVARDGL